jgi:hypothetical protein
MQAEMLASSGVDPIRGGTLQPNRNPNAGKVGFTDPSTGQFYDTEQQIYNEYDPRIQQGIDTQLQSGQSTLEQANARARLSPEDLARDRFQRYTEMVRPQQRADFDKLLGGMALQGTSGNVNNLTGSNVAISSFAQGLANSDREAYDRSIMTEQQLSDMIQQRGIRDYASAGAIEGLARQDATLGAEIGGRNVNSAAGQAAQYGAAAAQTRNTSSNQFLNTVTGGVGNFLQQNRAGIQQGLTNLFGGSTVPAGQTGGYGVDVGPRFNLDEGGI